MTEVILRKIKGGFIASDDASKEIIDKIKIGAEVRCKISTMRNYEFHKRYFAMLQFAFDYWEPPVIEVEVKTPFWRIFGKPEKEIVTFEKNFDRFRKDVQILAGFRETVVNIKGEARFESKSISFSRMDETEFQQLYKAVFSVVWKLVLSQIQGMTEQEAHNIINQTLGFE